MVNDQQRDAIKKIIEWYFDSGTEQLFFLSGKAGTGKTFLAKLIINILGLNISQCLFCAYTGKASLLLRQQGLLAQTIHRSFYNTMKLANGMYSFKKKASLPINIKLIIVDEFSMLNDKFIDDIRDFGVKILALGDINQLPPIIGQNSYMTKEKVGAHLTQIIRQEKDSPILQLADKAINHEYIRPGWYGNCRVCYMNQIENILEYDIILTWKNVTRRHFNRSIRIKKGLDNLYPTKGERLVCLKNNYFHDLIYNDIQIFPVNGLSLIALDNAEHKENDKYFNLQYKPEFITTNQKYRTSCEKTYFDNYINNIDDDPPIIDSADDIVTLDWGYSLTTNKSQGSSWPNVLCIDEVQGSEDFRYRWLYTSITRASQKITIVNYI